jgi:hypothetical protein
MFLPNHQIRQHHPIIKKRNPERSREMELREDEDYKLDF